MLVLLSMLALASVSELMLQSELSPVLELVLGLAQVLAFELLLEPGLG